MPMSQTSMTLALINDLLLMIIDLCEVVRCIIVCVYVFFFCPDMHIFGYLTFLKCILLLWGQLIFLWQERSLKTYIVNWIDDNA